MTDDEILAVVQAHKDGKRIEERFSEFPAGVWSVTTDPKWNFDKRDYRVAPEPYKPREWTIDVSTSKAWPFPEYSLNICNGWVRVREVIE